MVGIQNIGVFCEKWRMTVYYVYTPFLLLLDEALQLYRMSLLADSVLSSSFADAKIVKSFLEQCRISHSATITLIHASKLHWS